MDQVVGTCDGAPFQPPRARIESCPLEFVRIVAGGSTKKRPTTRSESWGGKVNSPFPRVPLSYSVRPFRHEKNGTCVLSVEHKRANQGRLLYCGQTFRTGPVGCAFPVSSQISPPAAVHQKRTRSGWNCFRQVHCSGPCLLRGCRVSHYSFVALAAMYSSVAGRAQRDQVLL